MRAAALSLLAALLAGSVAAEGLIGRAVTFGAMTYEVRETPIFLGERHPSVVSERVEYGLGPEGAQNGWDIIPAIIDIRADRVVITYPDSVGGLFPEVGFNGYVLDFLTDCVLFNAAAVDKAASTGTLTNANVFVEGARLYIDVGGQAYGPAERYEITLDVLDCPMS